MDTNYIRIYSDLIQILANRSIWPINGYLTYTTVPIDL